MKNITRKTARKIVPILGINVDSTSKERVLNQLLGQAQKRDFVAGAKPVFVVTPNPEIILRATKSQEFTQILNSAYFSVPDGVGLRVMGGVREIIPGRVLAEELIREAAVRGLRVFLLGGRAGIAAKAAEALSIKYSVLSIKSEAGPWVDENGRSPNTKQQTIEENVIKGINKFKPHFLFVGFGPPKQEFWLARNLPRLKVAVAMTVGGAFDYWAGKVPIPPKILSQAGFEWLWRLATQPWRLPRIVNAVIIFPLKLIWYRLTH